MKGLFKSSQGAYNDFMKKNARPPTSPVYPPLPSDDEDEDDEEEVLTQRAKRYSEPPEQPDDDETIIVDDEEDTDVTDELELLLECKLPYRIHGLITNNFKTSLELLRNVGLLGRIRESKEERAKLDSLLRGIQKCSDDYQHFALKEKSTK